MYTCSRKLHKIFERIIEDLKTLKCNTEQTYILDNHGFLPIPSHRTERVKQVTMTCKTVKVMNSIPFRKPIPKYITGKKMEHEACHLDAAPLTTAND